MKIVLSSLALIFVFACATGGPSYQWLDKQVSGDSLFYFHSTSGSVVSAINKDAIDYCATRGKTAVLVNRNPDGYSHFHSNYVCQ